MLKKVLLLTFILLVAASGLIAKGAQPKDMEQEMTSDVVSGDLEIFSWWAGDEGPALDALIKVFETQNPGVNVINATVAGGSGVNAKAVLKTRMLGGDPPETFQVHAGQELIGTWVVADRMEDLTSFFREQGLMDVYPKDLVKLLSTDKGIWSVPVNIHRSNVLWYMPVELEKLGVGVPASWDDFLAMAPGIQDMGIIPLSLATTWTANHLWESVALDVLGPDNYDRLWAGKLSWTSPDVVKVWETFGKILEFTNTDADSLSWQQATDMVTNGQAAFNVMGDWASGYMSTTLKLKPGVDYKWAASPGTKGVFMFLADSFGAPVGTNNPKATYAWLATCGSKEGSDAFNPLKGSISARTDADLSLYNVYSQSAAKDFAGNRIVGSLAHGVVANENFMNGFGTVMGSFLRERNAQKAAASCAELAMSSGMVN